LVLVVAVSLPVLKGDPDGALSKTAGMLFAPLYFGWTLSHAILLRATDVGSGGFILTLSVLGIVWVHDTMALLAGMASGGKTKLAPMISPKKSLEGSIGGALSMIAVMFLVYPLLSSRGYVPEIGPWQKAAFIVAAIICCNYGDLAESALKRDGGVKDSGKFLPGHGGFMDRIDSLLLFVPVSYWLFKLFLGW
ncbi:MAG TPA: phosphatidate cytidylyltransferase, partial [Bacillota bacterium]|nr:phosphatidate cytidylyltransferase [Bacillota bacterium]